MASATNITGADELYSPKVCSLFLKIIKEKKGGRKMKCKVRALFVIMLLCASVICGGILSMPIEIQSSTHVYPDHFPSQTLQQAIWNETVKDGDIIVVRQGTYYEHLLVNKSITIEGFDRSETVLDGANNGTVIDIMADNVKILELTLRHGNPYGIYLNSTTNCNVTRTIIENNVHGIVIDNSSNCFMRDNDIRYNTYNFGVHGAHITNDIDISNKVDGKPIYYWINQLDKEVPINAGYVALVNCANITIKNLSLKNNVQGALVSSSTNIKLHSLDIRDNIIGVEFDRVDSSIIENVSVVTPPYEPFRFGCAAITLKSSTNNLIVDNSLLHRGYAGIELEYLSENNTINNNFIKNTLYYNKGLGICLYSDSNTVISNTIMDNEWSIWVWGNNSIFYHNNFINNPLGVQIWETCFNLWNLTREGNYWDDITGFSLVDSNGDGIIDPPCKKQINPYNIDYHPLNETWSSVREINATLWHILREPGDKQYNITLYSDNVIASRKFTPNWTQGYGLITFNITASTAGICSVDVPRARLDSPIELKINGTLVDHNNYDLTVINGTHLSLRFNYTEGRHMVEIKGYQLGFAIGDINGDGKVSMDDVMIVIDAFGKKYP
ncbi:MAG: right-handed parallel beta-helix repeat-containing protein [Candidatus Bathyarchaeota archaeon]|nr:right-handed parallel beta-helix repeat-containing protein [Candidatus Bathyarchaeota archaeon]